MSLALKMARFMIGQFGIRPFTIDLIYSLGLGLPIKSCRDQALHASEYTLTMYLFLIESTVLIMTCVVSFLLSEKYKPFFEGINTWLVTSALWTTNPVFIELCTLLYMLHKDKIFAMSLGFLE